MHGTGTQLDTLQREVAAAEIMPALVRSRSRRKNQRNKTGSKVAGGAKIGRAIRYYFVDGPGAYQPVPEEDQ